MEFLHYDKAYCCSVDHTSANLTGAHVFIIWPLWSPIFFRYQVIYQIGVFVSRSSVNIIQIKKIWILPILQVNKKFQSGNLVIHICYPHCHSHNTSDSNFYDITWKIRCRCYLFARKHFMHKSLITWQKQLMWNWTKPRESYLHLQKFLLTRSNVQDDFFFISIFTYPVCRPFLPFSVPECGISAVSNFLQICAFNIDHICTHPVWGAIGGWSLCQHIF